MANFLQALQAYYSSDISIDELFGEIDQLLEHEGISATWMLTKLTAENAQNPLPPHAFEAIKQRLNSATNNKPAYQTNSSRSGETFGVVTSSEFDGFSLGDQRSIQPWDDGLHGHGAQSSNVTANSRVTTDSTSKQAENHIKGEGDTLNERFELKKRIGSGYRGIVYKALDRRKMEAVARDPYVAVKILNRKFSVHHGWLTALQRKVQNCQHLVHPNIGRVYDFNRDGETVYVTMEFLYGESLAHKMRADDFTGIPFQQAQPIINAMGKALACAHQSGIIHYQFKPDNVFLTDAGEVKVTDFFIAPAYLSSQHGAPSHPSETVELDMQSPVYASPEMLEQLDPDPRDDIFALACTTYKLLTGRHPFNEMLATQAREKLIKPTAPKALKPRQWKVLKSALSLDRSERAPTVERFFADLNVETRTKQYGLPITAAVAAGAAGMIAFGMNYFFAKLNTPVASDFSKFENPPAVERTPAHRTDVQPPPTAHQPPVPTTKITPDSSLASEQDFPAQPTTVSAGPTETEPSNQNIKPPGAAIDSGDSFTGHGPVKHEQVATLTKHSPREGLAPGQSEFEWPTEESQMRDQLEAMVEAEIQLRVTDLLERAEQQMVALQLTTPVGDSAFDTYQQMLQLAPGHDEAEQGIERIKSQYQQWAEAAIQKGELKTARVYLGRAIAIDPEDATLIEALSKLSNLEPSADDVLGNSAGQPLKTPLLDTIQQRKQVLDYLLLKAQRQLAAHQLVRPEDDNAAETFGKVLQIDPANRWAREGLQTITIQLEAMARAKQQEGDLDASLSIVDDGLQILPDHASLRALRDALNRQVAEAAKAPHTTEQPDQ